MTQPTDDDKACRIVRGPVVPGTECGGTYVTGRKSCSEVHPGGGVYHPDGHQSDVEVCDRCGVMRMT